MNKRNDLQWLRAVAILAVCGFHLVPQKIPYGFLGVDIFFVISGYLMTVILQKNCDILTFYLNRVKRIFPVYVFVTTILCIMGYFLLLPMDYDFFKTETIWSVFFVNNMYPIFHQTQYFEMVAEYKFLLHTWSLGVEIQFYLIAPFFIKFLLSRAKPLFWIALFNLFSFLCQFFVPSESISFGLVFCRIWQFLVGTFVYCYGKKDEKEEEENASHIRNAKNSRIQATTMKKQTAQNVLIIFMLVMLYFFRLIIFVSYGIVDAPFIYPDILRILEDKNSTMYLLKPDTTLMCNEQTELLIIVFSHIDDLGERMLVRRTWATEKLNTTELKFLVGHKTSLNNALLKENLVFNDIIMTNIPEEYYNLSIKTLTMILYQQNNCPNVKCLMKVDSDNVIDISQFEELCKMRYKHDEIHGYCLNNMLVLRRKTYSNKWDIPYYVFENQTYPTYCRGGHYLLTGKNTTEKLLNGLKSFGFFTSLNKQKMPEDVLFTGIAAEIAHVPRINNTKIIPCFKNGLECLYNQPLPKSWISATVGNENMNYYHSCTLSLHWKDCVNLL